MLWDVGVEGARGLWKGQARVASYHARSSATYEQKSKRAPGTSYLYEVRGSKYEVLCIVPRTRYLVLSTTRYVHVHTCMHFCTYKYCVLPVCCSLYSLNRTSYILVGTRYLYEVLRTSTSTCTYPANNFEASSGFARTLPPPLPRARTLYYYVPTSHKYVVLPGLARRR